MKLHDLFEFETKHGDAITFDRQENFEHHRVRGDSQWVVHRVTALVDDIEAGYLNISYIPKENLRGSSLLNFMDIQGWPLDLKGKNWKGLDRKGKEQALETIIKYTSSYSRWQTAFDAIPGMSDDDLNKRIDAYEHRLRKSKHGRAYKEFYSFHVDKPLVDYIKVEPMFKRQGIGTALYQEGSKWMKEKGMVLHASGTQSDEAKATWDAMGSKLDVQKTKHKRRFLNV